MSEWRGIGIILVGADGGISIRTGKYVGSDGFANNGLWVGGPLTAEEATLLALVANASEDVGKEPVYTSIHETSHERAVALGSAGGKVGGPARARALSAARRSEIASKAARTRWAATHAASLPFPEKVTG